MSTNKLNQQQLAGLRKMLDYSEDEYNFFVKTDGEPQMVSKAELATMLEDENLTEPFGVDVSLKGGMEGLIFGKDDVLEADVIGEDNERN